MPDLSENNGQVAGKKGGKVLLITVLTEVWTYFYFWGHGYYYCGQQKKHQLIQIYLNVRNCLLGATILLLTGFVDCEITFYVTGSNHIYIINNRIYFSKKYD